MKKIITFSAFCIIASLLFSSCSSNLSIAKRHFNNGYYIAYSKSKQVVHTPKEVEKAVQTKAKEPLYSPQNKTEQNTIGEYADQSPVTVNKDIVVSNVKTQHKAISQRNIKQALKQKNKIFEYPASQINHTLFEPVKVNSDSSDDHDGLSLFWVVILIILVLWAVGFWGLGLISGLINLLLLIALILLILWLLRIV